MIAPLTWKVTVEDEAISVRSVDEIKVAVIVSVSVVVDPLTETTVAAQYVFVL